MTSVFLPPYSPSGLQPEYAGDPERKAEQEEYQQRCAYRDTIGKALHLFKLPAVTGTVETERQ